MFCPLNSNFEDFLVNIDRTLRSILYSTVSASSKSNCFAGFIQCMKFLFLLYKQHTFLNLPKKLGTYKNQFSFLMKKKKLAYF